MNVTDSQIRSWLHNLARKPISQWIVVLDLLDHAIGDGMIADDVAICQRAVTLLETEVLSNA